MTRVLATARMQLVHPLASIGVPLAIMTSAFVVNLVIWRVGDVAAKSGGEGSTGGLLSLYLTVLIVFIQAVTQMFPFAMGLSLSRRDFYLGTALAATVQAVGYGVALTVLASIEDASHGWGMGLRFFAPGILHVANPALRFLVLTVPMLAFAFAGMGIGVVAKRWAAPGLFVLGISLLLLAGLAAIWLTWQRSWTHVGSWLADLSVGSLTIAFPAVLALVLAGLTFLGLRRAVP